jgi:hypothetical protein
MGRGCKVDAKEGLISLWEKLGEMYDIPKGEARNEERKRNYSGQLCARIHKGHEQTERQIMIKRCLDTVRRCRL